MLSLNLAPSCPRFAVLDSFASSLILKQVIVANTTLQADLSVFANSTENDLLSIIDIKKRDTNVSAALASALETAKTNLKINDYYTIYLWNYCAWDGDDTYSYCSPKQAEFWFNPVDVWGLNSTGATIETLFPTSLKDSLKTYEAVSKAMFIFYIVALVCTCLELLVGISAMFSRWGSFFTTFFSAVRRESVSVNPLMLIY